MIRAFAVCHSRSLMSSRLSCSFLPLATPILILLRIFPIQGQGHHGVAIAVDAAEQGIQLASVQQQFTGTRRIAHHMRRSHVKRGDGGAKQVGFTVTERHVAVAEVGFACTQRFNFPPQRQARLELFFNEVFETRALVLGNGGGTGFVCFFFVIVRSLYWMLQRKKSFPVQHLRNFFAFWCPHPLADFCLPPDKWYYLYVLCLTGNDMPQISRSALVPFSAEQMYQLVNDVHSYPDFSAAAPAAGCLTLPQTR